ncbi:hypothetical protein QQF64_023757 [Cirrhinus molitorella]|uniref:Uncharacterized protein n=1 Tax=Cirrhinus molitorella TaxID=172907 RepID=A0ABR3NJK5_9TELE
MPRSLKPPYQEFGNSLDEVKAGLRNVEILIIDEVQEMRMTKIQEGHVPILDLRLRCGQKVLEVSLWHDEA